MAGTYGTLIDEDEVHDWDIARGPQTGGLPQLTMVLPTALRVFTNLVGGTCAAGGYALGKAAEACGAGKAVDSPAFRAGLSSWMWANGIFPKVQYEQTRDAGDVIASLYGTARQQDHDMTQTPMIISNHISYLDGGILATLFKLPKVVAMSGTRSVPIAGQIAEEMEAVFVDRGNSESRHSALEGIFMHCAEWKPGMRPMLIFPEGTTTNGQGLLPFKKGAFTAGVPVRPVLLVYTGQWDPASTTYRTTDTGLKEVSDNEWAMQFLGHFMHSVHVHVLPPYVPNVAEKEDPELYAQKVQAYMAAELERVRWELHCQSWKKAAGRKHGGLGYQFGDFARMSLRSQQ